MSDDVPTTSAHRAATITAAEAATWLGCSVRMIHHYTRTGQLVPDKRAGRVMLFSPATLSAFHATKRGAA